MKKPITVETLPAVRLDPINVPLTFHDASNQFKKHMLAEYKSLGHEEKKAWRDTHDVTQQVVNYYSKKLKVKGGRSGPSKGHPAGQRNPKLEAITLEMLDEYLALPRDSGQKSEWLKEHDLNHQQIFEVKKQLRPDSIQRGKFNGARRKQHISYTSPAIPVTIPVPVTRSSTTSLDEAINAMKVKRDMLSEFIADLERMRH